MQAVRFPTTQSCGHGAKGRLQRCDPDGGNAQTDNAEARGQFCSQEPGLAEPLPAGPAGLGTGGEARDLDVVPTFPLKLLFSRDSSSA